MAAKEKPEVVEQEAPPAPVGSRTYACVLATGQKSGEEVVVPEATAKEIDKWLGDNRKVATGRIFDREVQVISYPDYQEKRFRF